MQSGSTDVNTDEHPRVGILGGCSNARLTGYDRSPEGACLHEKTILNQGFGFVMKVLITFMNRNKRQTIEKGFVL